MFIVQDVVCAVWYANIPNVYWASFQLHKMKFISTLCVLCSMRFAQCMYIYLIRHAVCTVYNYFSSICIVQHVVCTIYLYLFYVYCASCNLCIAHHVVCTISYLNVLYVYCAACRLGNMLCKSNLCILCGMYFAQLLCSMCFVHDIYIYLMCIVQQVFCEYVR